jgi:hypothetical protein
VEKLFVLILPDMMERRREQEMRVKFSARVFGARGVWAGVLSASLFLVFIPQAGNSQQRKQPQVAGKTAQARASRIAPDVQSALSTISADSLRGHLSFIASDLLEGRGTPSRGLDIAAEYIAAQFRRAGLEPAGDPGTESQKSYFQLANWRLLEPNIAAFEMIFEDGTQTLRVPVSAISFASDQTVDLKSAPLLKVDYNAKAAVEAMKGELVGGKVIFTEIPDFRSQDRSQWMSLRQQQIDFANRMKSLGAAFILSIDRTSPTGRGVGTRRLVDPERQGGAGGGPAAPFLTVHDPKITALFDSMKGGEPRGMVTLKLDAPLQTPVKLRNVAGLLRGSDPVLKETCVIVSAHYDHLGIGAAVNGDSIYNGANDDGSGTVSVIELASALSKLKTRPKRSILFLTWFGEERGLLGSRYYGRHPIFPLEKTVAMVNLEQVGRTDDSEGPQVGTATMTGFDYTDMGPIFKAAGEKTGVKVYKHEQNSDDYFGRSDNQALADAGVPAHTLGVAFEFPDYHQPGDVWEKIDYENMAKVDRMIALALATIANSVEPPKWNEANPKTAKYVQAWKSLMKN